MINDLFWSDNINILFNKRRLIEFFPTKDMSQEEKLNAISRLSIYMGILLFLYKGKFWAFYIPLVVLTFCLFLYKTSQKSKLESEAISKDVYNTNSTDPLNDSEVYPKKLSVNEPESVYNKNCVKPTKDNPFMNFTVNQYLDNPERPPACDGLNDNVVANDMERNFNYNLYKDVGDVFGKNNSQRQFYTTPYTTASNDQGAFANWLYKVGPTCKEGNECYRYEDLRSNRGISMDDENNPINYQLNN